ncbi:hypothetical protein [Streptomyces heilongjiangensis]|uniref:Uncharacterized protein n=1 Tax=Streptomyces heilongjiangensis TaxID=945052 RepID=A0ABW1BIV7_9ACTN|nr:hypothetical protein [Streptomyces heilongjiangensis]MDC2952225.1 hypothetical protein [Streptomyces heilongjiangensis]
MAVQRAHSPGGALHLLRRQLGSRLPIDILTTHYPDHRGQVLLNVASSGPLQPPSARPQLVRGSGRRTSSASA